MFSYKKKSCPSALPSSFFKLLKVKGALLLALSFNLQSSYALLSPKDEVENKSQARQVVQGVYDMYSQHFEIDPFDYYLKTDEIVSALNASYSRNNQIRTLNFPNILLEDGGLYKTSRDQGIVAHEAGHMFLDYFKPQWLNSNSSHIGAFHEAFADLTSHFYRFYNPSTRKDFVDSLKNGAGCVGDNGFSCVRNNSISLTLYHVNQNRSSLCEIHELSKTFSSAIYNNMVSCAQKEGANIPEIVNWHQKMLLKTVLATKNSSVTLMDIAYEMINVSSSTYGQGLGMNFIQNGLLFPIYQSSSVTYVVPNTKFQQLCLQETADLPALKKKTTFVSSKGKKQEEDGDSCVIL